MNKICSACGYEAQEGDTFSIFVDPKSEWWLTLLDCPQYCDKCTTIRQSLSRAKLKLIGGKYESSF